MRTKTAKAAVREVEIGRHRCVEIHQVLWHPDVFAAEVIDDNGRSVAVANGATPSAALQALAVATIPPAEDRPSINGVRRKEMAPRDDEERRRMVWSFREGCRRLRKVMEVCGFELQALIGVLGDDTMAQRCVPRVDTEP